MKSFVAFMTLLLTLAACDKPLIRPKGSDVEWQQKQEQIEHEKHPDQNHLDQERQQEEQSREVRVDHDRTIDPIKLNPANN